MGEGKVTRIFQNIIDLPSPARRERVRVKSSIVRNTLIIGFLILTFWGLSLEGCMDDVGKLSISGPYPCDTIVARGGIATFQVYGQCGEPCGGFGYQWKKNGADLSDAGPAIGAQISGSMEGILHLTNVQLTDAGSYTCLVTYGTQAKISTAAILKVPAP